MYYSTLWYENNPLLLQYQKFFLGKLRSLWNVYFEETMPSDDFLLYPDVHSLLLALPHMEKRMDELKAKVRIQLKVWNEGSQKFVHPEFRIGETSIELTDIFYNPYIDTDSHPDHIRNGIAVTFWDKAFQEWEKLFSQTFDVLRKTSPGFYEEIHFLLKKILPFWVSNETHNSGSYSNAIGHITMSYPDGVDSPEIVILEALIHEYNHNKINLILQHEVLLLNDYSEIYYSPFRPDPRTIHGVYLWLHALSAAYWVIWKAYSEGSIFLLEKDLKKGVIYVLKNSLSIQMLQKYAHTTNLWRIFFQEMKNVHTETLGFMRHSSLPKWILESAKSDMKEHYEAVCKAYPSVLG